LFREIERCRVCGNTNLTLVLDLGWQCLTGWFPKSPTERVEQMPLQLVKCMEESNPRNCGLLQLKHTFSLDKLYGENYGYRSGLNTAMVAHLNNKARQAIQLVPLKPGDLVVDIGSNDGTLLQAYPQEDLSLLGIDPTGEKFRSFYPEHINLIADFFSAAAVRSVTGNKRAKIVTSVAMFYDLEDPLSFMRQIREILDDEGVWVFEQSYMPRMLAMNSYDTVCHEHLEYYALKQIRFMVERAGLKIAAVDFNEINGGSFSVVAAKQESPIAADIKKIAAVLQAEIEAGLDSERPYREFNHRVNQRRDELCVFLEAAAQNGQKTLGYGASTKGNVILQFCRIHPRLLPCIAEVNSNKFGAYTPGTGIPIVSEQEAKAMQPDCFLVLPWHFRSNITARERSFLAEGGKLLFPLPTLEVISLHGSKPQPH